VKKSKASKYGKQASRDTSKHDKQATHQGKQDEREAATNKRKTNHQIGHAIKHNAVIDALRFEATARKERQDRGQNHEERQGGRRQGEELTSSVWML
jgi:hypothetical protein